jgi:hypothetical protein
MNRGGYNIQTGNKICLELGNKRYSIEKKLESGELSP